MNQDDEIKRGREARQLLEHPLLNEAFTTLDSEIATSWKSSPARDAEGREKLYLMQALLTRIHLHLNSIMETGMLAATTAQAQSRRAAGQSTLLD